MSVFHLDKFKNLKISGARKKDIEPQEIFLDKLARRKEEEFGLSEKKFEIPLSQKIIKASFLFIVFIIIIFLGTAFYLQVLGYDKYSALSDNNKFIISFIKADRGAIYDIKGKQLVFNQPSFDLLLNKEALPEEEKERILEEVCKIAGCNGAEIEEKLKISDKDILVSENLNYQTLILLETKLNNLPGFYIEYNSTRYYENGYLFSHIIGYTGIGDAGEYTGKEGVEKSYDEILRRNPGKIKLKRDAHGNILSRELISYPESGESLVLWIDSDLQNKIYDVLSETLERTGSKKAVGIALNPKTGGVMALASIPSYNNNLFTKGADQLELKNLLTDSDQPLFNRAVAGLYSTGSTIKPLIASAAMEEKLINYKKDIMCRGEIEIPHKYNPDITYYYKDWSVHGATDLRKALAESCNVYFYTIGGGYKNQEGLGPSRIKKYLELFGWGAKTNIDLPGEAVGLIPSPEWKKENKNEDWWDGDTYHLSIGQGDLLVSPLQVAAAYAAIANGGTFYSPRVVKEIIGEDKNIIKEIGPEIIRKDFISPENLAIVREGMRWAVTGENSPQASSIMLNSLPVAAAAKTGTAQTGIDNFYHNWIGAFAPYEDPEIVLVIMIENVENLQAAALPSAKSILEWYFSQNDRAGASERRNGNL